MKQTLLEQYEKEIERRRYEKEVQNLNKIISDAKTRHELIQALTNWYGEYLPEYMDSHVYERFPLTKLEKALK